MDACKVLLSSEEVSVGALGNIYQSLCKIFVRYIGLKSKVENIQQLKTADRKLILLILLDHILMEFGINNFF